MDVQRQVALQFSELIDVNSNTRKDQGWKRHISPGREEGDAVIFPKTISERFPAALPNCTMLTKPERLPPPKPTRTHDRGAEKRGT
jgi:hypothetical protein